MNDDDTDALDLGSQIELSQEDKFWEDFDNADADVITMMWFCDTSFDVPETGEVREIFACSTKSKIIQRLYTMITSGDISGPCEFDPSPFTTKAAAIKNFYTSSKERTLFVGLIPVY